MRLIDADALRKCFEVPHELKCGIQAGMDEYALKCIDKQPTIDAVPVVRCKDCKHRPTGTGINHDIEFPDARCPCQCYENYWYSWMPSDDWYCANGEKMEVQE